MDKWLKILFLVVIIAAIGFMFGVGNSDKHNNLEKLGERGDEIIDNIKDGDPILHKKGSIEKAGEAIDNSINNITGDKK